MVRRVKAVIDRIVDGEIAVLLVNSEQRQLEYAAHRLPEQAREGTWLQLTLDGDQILSVVVDVQETESATQRIRDKMELLRQRQRRQEN